MQQEYELDNSLPYVHRTPCLYEVLYIDYDLLVIYVYFS